MTTRNELFPNARTPSNPLPILQAELEGAIQLAVHTLALYEKCVVKVTQNKYVKISDLGYEQVLCNMAVVNAASALDGFKGNIVRSIRTNHHTFDKGKLNKYFESTRMYTNMSEPLARRDCIAHNLARVDPEYKKEVPNCPLPLGTGLDTNLAYLQDTSANFFETAVEVVTLLVADNLLSEEHKKTLGAFRRNPVVNWTN